MTDTAVKTAQETQDTQDTYCAVMTSKAVEPQQAVAKGLYRDYEGQRYYFCCHGCLNKFDADPAKYAKN